jgi:hypothetical protein
MEGAVFDYSELTGTRGAINVLSSTNLSRSTNNGGLLWFVDLTEATFDEQTDFRNAFLDGRVKITEAFRAQMGTPCQWMDAVLDDDAEFYGRWRGWIEMTLEKFSQPPWRFIAPEGFQNVEAIPPDEDCEWKTGPGAAVE